MAVLSFLCYVLSGATLCFALVLYLGSFDGKRINTLKNEELVRLSTFFAAIIFFLGSIILFLLGYFVFGA